MSDKVKKRRMSYHSEIRKLNSHGEIEELVETNVFSVPREPAFVKLYLEDLSKLLSIPEGPKNLIYELLKQMNYEGLIVLNSGIKRIIAERLNLKEQSVRNNLSLLTKKGFLKNVETGVYEMNPFIFAKGDWVDICKRRDQFDKFRLEITYDNGMRSIRSELIKNEKSEKLVTLQEA